MTIHDGNEPFEKWQDSPYIGMSHVERLTMEAAEAAKIIGRSAYYVSDRYYLGKPFLSVMAEARSLLDHPFNFVVMCKSDILCYEPLPVDYVKKGRGRPPIKGVDVHLCNWFTEKKCDFAEIEVEMYGKTAKARCLAADLLWGKGAYVKLRFFLIIHNGKKRIICTDDFTMTAEQAVALYCPGIKIEGMFKSLKTLGGLDCHFWSRSIPRINRFGKAGDPEAQLSKMEEAAGKSAAAEGEKPSTENCPKAKGENLKSGHGHPHAGENPEIIGGESANQGKSLQHGEERASIEDEKTPTQNKKREAGEKNPKTEKSGAAGSKSKALSYKELLEKNGSAAKRLLGCGDSERVPQVIAISREMRQAMDSHDRTQKYILVNCMGLGLLQAVSLKFSGAAGGLAGWIKTVRGSCPSEARTREALSGVLADAESRMPDLPLFVTLQGMAGGERPMPKSYCPGTGRHFGA
jgi:hypothetical protein